MYKQLKDVKGNISSDIIQRISDGAFIPNNKCNRDWQEYQEWLKIPGNTPLPPE